MIAVRSALFLVWFTTISIAMHLMLLPSLLFPRRIVVGVSKLWVRVSFFGLKWIAGLTYEVRGREFLPTGPALVASKHYSAWETLAFTEILNDPATVMKRELLWFPLFGWYLSRAGMIPVDRKAGAAAIRRMRAASERALADRRQIVIFPEGERRTPGAEPAYKPGVAALYAQLKVPCVPVALDSGRYWQGLWKRPGTIVVEFLPPIPPGLPRAQFMRRLEEAVETASRRLLTSGQEDDQR